MPIGQARYTPDRVRCGALSFRNFGLHQVRMATADRRGSAVVSRRGYKIAGWPV